jgi:hypothetical protein
VRFELPPLKSLTDAARAPRQSSLQSPLERSLRERRPSSLASSKFT